MEKLNQLFFIVFAMFLLGIYLSAIKIPPDKDHPYITWFWPVSILTRAGAFLVWASVPVIGNEILVLANVLYVASLISMLLTFRAWRTKVTKWMLIAAVIFLIIYALIFEYVKASFFARFEMLIFAIATISIFELIEIFKNTQKEKSYLLKLIFLMAFLQFAMTGITFDLIYKSINKSVNNVLQNTEAASIGIWMTFSLHLIIYVVINSFLYQKLWESEKHTHGKLNQSNAALKELTNEKKEIKRLLVEREELVSRLLKANKTVSTGALSASIAHELNQPLTVIQMNIRLLGEITKAKNKPVNEKMQEELIAEILENNRRASKVVKSLREIFSQNAKDFERTELVQIIHSVIGISQSEIQRQKINLDLTLPNEVYANVFPQEILQIVLNLFNNALNALSKIERSDKRIKVVLQISDNWISLKVEDNGMGISPKMQAQLFELLAETKGSGMGLGLWLCRYVLKHHQGKIWYETVETGGARFCLEFPANLVSYKLPS